MLTDAGAFLGTVLRPKTLQIEDFWVETEGTDPGATIVVQLVANRGRYKTTFRNKVMADMFKLLWLRQSVPTAQQAVLVICEPATPALSGWVRRAADDMGVKILVWNEGIVEPEDSASTTDAG